MQANSDANLAGSDHGCRSRIGPAWLCRALCIAVQRLPSVPAHPPSIQASQHATKHRQSVSKHLGCYTGSCCHTGSPAGLPRQANCFAGQYYIHTIATIQNVPATHCCACLNVVATIMYIFTQRQGLHKLTTVLSYVHCIYIHEYGALVVAKVLYMIQQGCGVVILESDTLMPTVSLFVGLLRFLNVHMLLYRQHRA